MNLPKPFKAIVLDLDGTLLRSDKTVAPPTLDLLLESRRRGARLVIATARPRRSVRLLLPSTLFEADTTLVCCNGAEVWEADQCVYHDHLAPDTTRAILAVIERHCASCGLAEAPPVRVSLEIDDVLFTNQPLAADAAFHVVAPKAGYTVAVLEEVAHRPAAKVLVDLSALRDVPALLQALAGCGACSVVASDNGTLGQIMASSVSKAAAVAWALERAGLTLGDAIAFGDDVNDADLLAQSALGVAMGNAAESVKAVADRVTATNDANGVAVVLDELIAAGRL